MFFRFFRYVYARGRRERLSRAVVASAFLAACGAPSAAAEPPLSADSVPTRAIHQLGFDFRTEYVLPTHDFLRGWNAQAKPVDKTMSLHLKYAFRFAQDSYFGRLYPGTYQGLGVSCNTFFNPSEVGSPVSVYAFQGSRIKRLSQRLSFDYEWNFGASFGWEPYDPAANPMNTVVGSKVNAYINFGLFLNWELAPQWLLAAGAGVTHYSNGNTRYPNAGINSVGARIGIARLLNADGKKRRLRPDSHSAPEVERHVSYDIVVYGATRAKGIVEESYLVPGSFAIIGVNFNPMYNFNKYLKAGLSLDGQYDESANIKDHVAVREEYGEMKFYRPPLNESIGIGLSARGEFVMPIFSINIGIGHNFIYKGDDMKGFYQMAILKANVTRNVFVHIGYQLSGFKDPHNLMIGLGCRFHNKRR